MRDFFVLAQTEQSCYAVVMENLQEPLDLSRELRSIIAAGHRVTFRPNFTPYGVVYTLVTVQPVQNPFTPEQPQPLPWSGNFNLALEMDKLAAWLHALPVHHLR